MGFPASPPLGDTLAGLLDVNLTGPVNRQGLVFDTASSKWVNAGFSGALVLADPVVPQAIPQAAWTAIILRTVVTDPDGYFAGANPTRLTVAETGLYVMTGSFDGGPSADQNCVIEVVAKKSGATFLSEYGNHRAVWPQVFLFGVGISGLGSFSTFPIPLTAGQYLEAMFRFEANGIGLTWGLSSGSSVGIIRVQ